MIFISGATHLGVSFVLLFDYPKLTIISTDPRNESWPLMSSPIPTLVILVIYLSFVKYGPIWMKKRKPYDLRFLLVVYNFAVTGLNGWMAFEVRMSSVYKSLEHNKQESETFEETLTQMIRQTSN